jgi:predicted nucleotidyltransferase
MTKAKEFAVLIENKFKEILFLGISGSVASGHPKENDDIDLLIVTKADTLWKNRFKLRWWVYKNKIPHRKYDKTELKDQFCFNLWLDVNYLQIPKNRQNLKNAIDLLILIPLINKKHTYEKFVLANVWAKKFVATGYSKKILNFKYQMPDKIKNKKNTLNKIINCFYFWPQYWYMKPKIFKEKVVVGLI